MDPHSIDRLDLDPGGLKRAKKKKKRGKRHKKCIKSIKSM
jgi:hypothetical protein